MSGLRIHHDLRVLWPWPRAWRMLLTLSCGMLPS
jgi:hypothetical protein